MENTPKTYEEMEISLILGNKALKKAKEDEIAEKLKCQKKQAKMVLRDLRRAEEEGGELIEESEKDEDEFKGDDF